MNSGDRVKKKQCCVSFRSTRASLIGRSKQLPLPSRFGNPAFEPQGSALLNSWVLLTLDMLKSKAYSRETGIALLEPHQGVKCDPGQQI